MAPFTVNINFLFLLFIWLLQLYIYIFLFNLAYFYLIVGILFYLIYDLFYSAYESLQEFNGSIEKRSAPLYSIGIQSVPSKLKCVHVDL